MRIIHAEVMEIGKNYDSRHKNLRYISPSWLNSFLYCPYQIYLEKVLKIKPGETEAMISGKNAHLALEINHREAVEEYLTIPDALQMAKRNNVGYLFREVRLRALFDRYVVGGRIDELLILPDRVDIIDDKPGHRAYDGGIIQVYAYAHAFVSRYSPQVPVHAVIRSRDSGEEIYRGEFGARERERVEEIIKELLDVIYSRREPTVRINERKCASCRFRDVCPAYRGSDGGQS